jgi:transposase
LELTALEKEKFGELVALLAKHGFGEDGPPRETSFAQIEEFGHRAGQMVARAIDARLAEEHAAHFAGEEPCPSCGEKQLPEKSPHDLRLQTEDGEVPLREPAFHCAPCERDFFPSTHPAAD